MALGRIYENADAILVFDRALALGEDKEFVWCSRGVALHVLTRDDDAVHSFDRALTISHDATSALVGKSRVYFMLGDYAQSYELPDRTIGREPDNILALITLGSALVEQKQYEDAISVWERTISIYGRSESAPAVQGAALTDRGGRFTDAMNTFDHALSLDHSLPDGLMAK